MSLPHEMRSAANLFHGQLPFRGSDGLFALRIRRLRATIGAVSVSDDALPPSLSLSLDIGYRLRAPGRLEARRILQAGSALPVVINYAGTLNSIHGIVMYLNRCVPIPIDPLNPSPRGRPSINFPLATRNNSKITIK